MAKRQQEPVVRGVWILSCQFVQDADRRLAVFGASVVMRPRPCNVLARVDSAPIAKSAESLASQEIKRTRKFVLVLRRGSVGLVIRLEDGKRFHVRFVGPSVFEPCRPDVADLVMSLGEFYQGRDVRIRPGD